MNKYLILSIKQNSDLFYVVNSEYETCSCPVEMSEALCKHQKAIFIKFYISIFNFIPLLILNNYITYAYIVISK